MAPTQTTLFGLSRDAAGRLMLIDAEGVRHENVHPRRAFPLTDPEHWISICDERGQELALVDDPQCLPEQVRALLLDALERREFVPRVVRVHSILSEPDALVWDVETDRGRTTFRMEGEDHIHLLDGGRVLLTDIHGIRYLITDIHAFDAGSRRKLERYV
jgi:hypothetical protein